MVSATNAQLWCINNPGRPKDVRVISALFCQACAYQEVLDILSLG
jgi:hypothetical protein